METNPFRKIIVVRCGEIEVETLCPGSLSEEGSDQMIRTGKRLVSLLKDHIVALKYPDGHVHLLQSANILAAALGIKSTVLSRGDHPWDATAPMAHAQKLAPNENALVLVGGQRDQQRFQREFIQVGYRNLSAHLNQSVYDNDSWIFGQGSLWCADLEKRTLFCGRHRCRPPSERWVDRI